MKTFNLTENFSKKSGVLTVTIEGSMTLSNSASIKEELLPIIDKKQDTHIVVKNLTDIDLAGLQLLIALKKSIINNGKKAIYEVEFPSESQELIRRSGFWNILIPVKE